MAMTEDEAGQALSVCLKYIKLPVLARVCSELHTTVGCHTDNESLKQTLSMLARGSRKLLLQDAACILKNRRSQLSWWYKLRDWWLARRYSAE